MLKKTNKTLLIECEVHSKYDVKDYVAVDVTYPEYVRPVANRAYKPKAKDNTIVYFNYTDMCVIENPIGVAAYDYGKSIDDYKVYKKAPYGMFTEIHVYAYNLKGKAYWLVSNAIKYGTRVHVHLYGDKVLENDSKFYRNYETFTIEPIVDMNTNDIYVQQTEERTIQGLTVSLERYGYDPQKAEMLAEAKADIKAVEYYRSIIDHNLDAKVYNALRQIRIRANERALDFEEDLHVSRVSCRSLVADKFKLLATEGFKWGYQPEGDLYPSKSHFDSYFMRGFDHASGNTYASDETCTKSSKFNANIQYVSKDWNEKAVLKSIRKRNDKLVGTQELDDLYAAYMWCEENLDIEDQNQDYLVCPDCGHMVNKYSVSCQHCYLEFEARELYNFMYQLLLDGNKEKARVVEQFMTENPTIDMYGRVHLAKQDQGYSIVDYLLDNE